MQWRKNPWADPEIVHTGQHYDLNMSDAFFQDLGLPEPHIHLEAGLRSFDRAMPEEINRVVTDVLADILWTPSQDGDENLMREGISKEKSSGRQHHDRFPGNAAKHRPANVDDPEKLKRICTSLIRISENIPLLFPVHPRTGKNLEQNALMPMLQDAENIFLTDPLPYIRFMNLVFNCRMVITDSGGIQEETTYLGIPCLTLRPNTERPVTITQGTNQLCEVGDFEAKTLSILSHRHAQPKPIEFWDGKTAERVVSSIAEFFKIPTSEYT